MDEPVANLTREWLTKALHDLQTARITANDPDGPLDTAIYHCQQAAEKSVKGWFNANNLPFERTHDIRRLIRQAVVRWPDFAQLTTSAEILTPYATAFRYPGLADQLMPAREEFEEALAHAQAVYDFIVKLLPGAARP